MSLLSSHPTSSTSAELPLVLLSSSLFEKKIQHTSIVINSLTVYFPYEPYSAQLNYMESVINALHSQSNALLESPTGTGKTLCMLCAALAWMRAQNIVRIPQGNLLAAAETGSPTSIRGAPSQHHGHCGSLSSSVPGITVTALDSLRENQPQIFYLARTHAQLTQVIREFKKTHYANDMIMAVLGSREHLCLNSQVTQLPPVVQGGQCIDLITSGRCRYYSGLAKYMDGESSAARSGLLQNVNLHDIEDICEVGTRENFCPYYYEREMAKRADIVFAPYNYVFDLSRINSKNSSGGRVSRESHNPNNNLVNNNNISGKRRDTYRQVGIRGTGCTDSGSTLSSKGRIELPINLGPNSIIIVDEAHNIASALSTSLNATLTALDISAAIADVDRVVAIAEYKLSQELNNNSNNRLNNCNFDDIEGTGNDINQNEKFVIEWIVPDSVVSSSVVFSSSICNNNNNNESGFVDSTAFLSLMAVVKMQLITLEQALASMEMTIPGGTSAVPGMVFLNPQTAQECVKEGSYILEFLNKPGIDVNYATFIQGEFCLASVLLSGVKLLDKYGGARLAALLAASNKGTGAEGGRGVTAPGGGFLKYYEFLLHVFQSVEAISPRERRDVLDTSFRFIVQQVQHNRGNSNNIENNNKSKTFFMASASSFPSLSETIASVSASTILSSPPLALSSSLSSSKTYRNLSFWCLDVSLPMKSLASRVGPLLLTSGTLSPLGQFSSELGLDFPIRLQGRHIIDAQKQVRTFLLSNGPHNERLNSSFVYRQNGSYYRDLGRLIIKFSIIVPDGMLVFFPSYMALNSTVECWRNSTLMEGERVDTVEGGNNKTIWSLISEKKSIFVEPKSASELPFVISAYQKAAEGIIVRKKNNSYHENNSNYRYENYDDNNNNHNTNGAVLLAVSRGKISEGVDFADNHARCAVVCGIPFANHGDLYVRLKKEFYDKVASRMKNADSRNEFSSSGASFLEEEKKKKGENKENRKGSESNSNFKNKTLFTGKEWYVNEAIRAVNQCVGRVIRHKNDFGVIVLADERFGDYCELLSRWMKVTSDDEDDGNNNKDGGIEEPKREKINVFVRARTFNDCYEQMDRFFAELISADQQKSRKGRMGGEVEGGNTHGGSHETNEINDNNNSHIDFSSPQSYMRSQATFPANAAAALDFINQGINSQNRLGKGTKQTISSTIAGSDSHKSNTLYTPFSSAQSLCLSDKRRESVAPQLSSSSSLFFSRNATLSLANSSTKFSGLFSRKTARPFSTTSGLPQREQGGVIIAINNNNNTISSNISTINTCTTSVNTSMIDLTTSETSKRKTLLPQEHSAISLELERPTAAPAAIPPSPPPQHIPSSPSFSKEFLENVRVHLLLLQQQQQKGSNVSPPLLSSTQNMSSYQQYQSPQQQQKEEKQSHQKQTNREKRDPYAAFRKLLQETTSTCKLYKSLSQSNNNGNINTGVSDSKMNSQHHQQLQETKHCEGKLTIIFGKLKRLFMEGACDETQQENGKELLGRFKVFVPQIAYAIYDREMMSGG